MRPYGHTFVTRERFWTSARSAEDIFTALTRTAPRGMRSEGSGSESDHGVVTERNAEFDLKHLPAALASAELQVEVGPAGNGGNAVGVYAVVVPQPVRHRREVVPRSLRTVTVATVDVTDHSVSKQRTVTGRQARTLVRELDALRVEPPEGPRSCPLQLTANRATFVTHGHTWRVLDEVCGVDSVTRDHRRLPDLVPDKAFTHDLKAALR
jgi:hypothetical protein